MHAALSSLPRPRACDDGGVKRRRRKKPFALRVIEANAFWGDVIPPRSVVRLNAAWGSDQGRVFRIGYYSRMDGLNCVWLVNEAGTYEQTTNQRSIREDFTVVERSEETDHYGANREPLEALGTESSTDGVESR